MTLEKISCPNCGVENDATQSYCSQCQGNLYEAARMVGQRKRKSDPGTKWLVGCVVLLGALWSAYTVYRYNNPRPRASQKAVSSQDGARAIAGGHWVGCIDRDYHSKMNMYLVQDDLEAFKVALAARIAAGICTRFVAKERVFIADTAIFSGLVKLRREGDILEYWTNLESLELNSAFGITAMTICGIPERPG